MRRVHSPEFKLEAELLRRCYGCYRVGCYRVGCYGVTVLRC